MNRTQHPNPHLEGFLLQRLQFDTHFELPDWEKTGVGKDIPGYENYVKFVDANTIEIGKRPVAAAKDTSVKDEYGGKSLADLQTMCAMKSIRYERTMGKQELIQLLRNAK